ncbi:hypothetical protein [Aquisalibacillus elongatus]|nr:hypothetical protein [Aquisalibacillus elongatus]
MLVNELLDQEVEVYGLDNIQDDEKFERYALVARNADFHFSEDDYNEIDFKSIYDFSSNDVLCDYFSEKINKTSILIDDRIDMNKKYIVKFLASLLAYSQLPSSIHINGEEQHGIHLIKYD